MERLLEMLGILAALYVAYSVSLGKWNYDSPARREKRKEELKRAGLSSQFYYMNAGTLFILCISSGGTFTFFWLYEQWLHIRNGFRRSGNLPLRGSAFERAVAGLWSFFALGNLVNRTCEYTHRRTSWPTGLWGSMWLAGLVLIFSPVEFGWKIAGYILFCAVPVVIQRRINTLTREYLSLFPKAIELAATLIGVICVVVLVMGWKLLTR